MPAARGPGSSTKQSKGATPRAAATFASWSTANSGSKRDIDAVRRLQRRRDDGAVGLVPGAGIDRRRHAASG